MFQRRPKKIIECSDVRGWLDIATTSLELPARRRIAAEIQSHYNEAVASHIADGQSELSAKFMAMAELGDPHAASKRFKKSHLTKVDVSYMRARITNYANPFFSRKAIFIDSTPIIFLLLCYVVDLQFSRSLAELTFTWFSIAYIFFRLFPRIAFIRAKKFSQEVALSYIAGFLTWTLSLTFLHVVRHDLVHAITFFGFMSIVTMRRYFKIWRKLSNLDDSGPITPSPA